MDKEYSASFLLSKIVPVFAPWGSVQESDISQVQRLSGLSNVTIIVRTSKPSVEPSVLIIRFFMNELINLEQEQTAFKTLGEQGLGPKCYF